MASGSAFTLDFKPSYTPKSIREFLRELHLIGDRRRRTRRLEEYVNSLEEEQRKVDTFKRELPLCMLLLNDAIEALREEEMKWRKPVTEEFMSPIMSKTDGVRTEKDNRDKMNWMSSVGQWGSINNNNNNNDYNNNYKKKEASDVKEPKHKESEGYLAAGRKYSNQGGPFTAFKGFFSSRNEEKESVFPFPDLSLLSPGIKTPSAESGAAGCLNSKSIRKGLDSSMASGQSNLQPRKARRCWSPELHRRFVNALHQLGGPQVATPKQIRELMKVDGLTNDEVKSHLQKYRLHNRRIPVRSAVTANKQVVVLGGMWVPHEHRLVSKKSNSESYSPESPLQWTDTAQGIYSDDYEEDDEKSETFTWKGHIQASSN